MNTAENVVEITPTAYKTNGDEYARVTSVLNTIPTPALNRWMQEKCAQGAILAKGKGLSDDEALKFALQSPEEASKESREQGTTAHEIIRAVNAGQVVDLDSIVDPVVRKKVSNWIKFRSENKIETLYAERTLFSERYMIAGTLDHFGKLNGMIGLDDYKTGGVYDKAFIQLAAYNEVLKENALIAENVPLRVFQITEDDVVIHTPESFFLKGGRNKNQDCHIPTHEELFAVFRCALFVWRFQNIKVGKWDHLVKSFADLAKDTDTLLKALEGQWKR